MIPKIPAIKNPERYGDFELEKEKLEYALSEVIKKVEFALPEMTDRFPAPSSVNNVYPAVDNSSGWNQGFWTGILWHLYELTGKEKYKDIALSQIPSYHHRIVNKIGTNHHDMGFLYSPSCVAAWKLAGCEQGKEAAILAAEHLCSRFQEKGEFLQAWGDAGDPKAYRLIIDCLLNVPLLYWASEVTGDESFAEKAYKHYNTTIDVICRPDASTYHTYYFDVETGTPREGVTAQGAHNDSAWSRGQTWGMYGPLLTYIYKKNEKALDVFKATTNYFLNYIPSDYVPYWDLCFTDGDNEARDSSSAAIAVCAMLEGIKYMDEKDPLRKIYVNATKIIMNSLIDNYLTKDIPESNGLLVRATYSKPIGRGVDEMNIWGDYFYVEAIHRMLNPDWELYW